MNNKTKLPPLGFVKVDWIVQLVMLSIMLFCTFFGFIGGGLFIIAMLLLMPFGMWQVISGIIGAAYGSIWRMKYLAVVFAYFILSGIGSAIFQPFNGTASEIVQGVGIFLLFATPLVLGIWYMIGTFQDKKRLEAGTANKPTFEDMDDILDVAMLGED